MNSVGMPAANPHARFEERGNGAVGKDSTASRGSSSLPNASAEDHFQITIGRQLEHDWVTRDERNLPHP